MSLSSSPYPLTQAASHLHLYNSATAHIEEFKPLQKGHIGMYVCGPTVQSAPHIGHMRAAIVFDITRRWFSRLGFDVTYIRNVTDIDDKILNKSRQAKEAWWAWAYHFESEFAHDYELLNVLPPTYEPRATGTIVAMIDLTKRLLDRGHAYIVLDDEGSPTGNVFFDVSSWPEYGKLTHQQEGTDSEELTDGKRNPRDFALWKAPKEGDPSTSYWNTPFGAARPGWHLECSAISHRYLGDDFDIHGGGLDLRFPHHENELAQSQAAGYGFARLWMHLAWVTKKGEKMSKSLGNGLSVERVVAASSAWAVRYALGSTHYRSMLEWDDTLLSDAQKIWKRLVEFIDNLRRHNVDLPTPEAINSISADEFPSDFVHAMNEDIAVPQALASLFSYLRTTNSNLEKLNSAANSTDLTEEIAHSALLIFAMLDVFGLNPLDSAWKSLFGNMQVAQDNKVLTQLIESQLKIRKIARENKDFATADAIRDSLAQAGIIVKDTPQGMTWNIE